MTRPRGSGLTFAVRRGAAIVAFGEVDVLLRGGELQVYRVTSTERQSCRYCGGDIVWARTPRGKAIPIDAAPVDEDEIHQAHFATCPWWRRHRQGG